MLIYIEKNLAWLIPLASIVLGLFVYGFSDIRRFNFGRAWAISSVCFYESIRRRVLLIIPLALIGVLLVSQLQRPQDEQDAIRQTLKFSLFAVGMVVTITGLILACTNLPREIDSRVIYTVVTKPITRFEIVLGKVMGFARVSLTILLIMGLFTLGYLHVRAWQFGRDIRQRLAAGTIDPLSRPTYEYWASAGLLSSRTFERPTIMQVFAREPEADSRRWFEGGTQGDMIVPFHLTQQDLTPAGVPDANPFDAGVAIQLRIGFERTAPETKSAGDIPIGVAAPAPALVQVEILDSNLQTLIESRVINGGNMTLLPDQTGNTPVGIYLPPEVARNLMRSPTFYVEVLGVSQGISYFVDISEQKNPLRQPACVVIPGPTSNQAKVFASAPGMPSPRLRGRGSLYGELLRGGPVKTTPVAIYSFSAKPGFINGETVPFEFRAGIERNSADETETAPTRLEVTVRNRASGERSEPLVISPESNRTTYFTLPAKLMADGNFDIYVHNTNTGQFASITDQSVAMVASDELFDVNLLKSLSILWALSILVVIVSICCSTFLSWPIAIVLTLLVLLGHWGIGQVSDALSPGIGNLVAQDLFGTSNASDAKVVSASVDAMAKVLNQLADVLPDIGRFAAIDDIERGVTISPHTMLDPLLVLASFGIPMLVLSYVFLCNKEVAP